MKRLFSACAFLALTSAVLIAQQSGQQDPYEGTSKPPANDAIMTDDAPAKPPAGRPMNPVTGAPAADGGPAQAAPQAPDQEQTAPAQDNSQNQPQPTSVDPNANLPTQNSGDDIVTSPQAAQAPAQPALESRSDSVDPDGDIVHPAPLAPGEIASGTTIFVRLLDRLSTAETEKGQPFRSRVTADVVEGGQVLIPAGTEIDGTVVQVSTGHAGASGYLRLRPEIVILADGTRLRLHAEVSGTSGSNTHVVGEGTIKPDSRWRRDGIEYGGAVGAGAVTGAVLAGPVGALTGGLIGAGVITTHLLVDHPQATLEPGTTLLFTLTDPLYMTAANASGN
ncbi:MAG TPA: hypothetical protein VLZ50_02580 [Terracidiphilus sp.]|nr:hypothetical protein [Terracidiphilus sp.]